MDRTWALILSISCIILYLVFFIHSFLKFRDSPNRGFFRSWVLFWGFQALQYVFITAQYLWIVSTYKVALTLFYTNLVLGVLAISFLGICSEFFYKTKTKHYLKIAKWILPIVVILILLFGFSIEFYWLNLLIAYLNFFAITIYAVRFFKVYDKKIEWMVVLLLLYASLFFIYPMINKVLFMDNLSRSFLYSLILPLNIIIYISGYFYLSSISFIKNPDKKKTKNSNDQEIAPTIAVSLTGIWGFLFIMWKYPFGRVVVLIIAVSLLLALIFITTNLALLKALLENL